MGGIILLAIVFLLTLFACLISLIGKRKTLWFRLERTAIITPICSSVFFASLLEESYFVINTKTDEVSKTADKVYDIELLSASDFYFKRYWQVNAPGMIILVILCGGLSFFIARKLLKRL
ncbi:MAG: hypothetical protein IJ151_05165 [Bacteroidales bacterium]|nr:hypothetical protein [Bacteroidales bacterium]